MYGIFLESVEQQGHTSEGGDHLGTVETCEDISHKTTDNMSGNLLSLLK